LTAIRFSPLSIYLKRFSAQSDERIPETGRFTSQFRDSKAGWECTLKDKQEDYSSHLRVSSEVSVQVEAGIECRGGDVGPRALSYEKSAELSSRQRACLEEGRLPWQRCAMLNSAAQFLEFRLSFLRQRTSPEPNTVYIEMKSDWHAGCC
jgi:hypothetical protein